MKVQGKKLLALALVLALALSSLSACGGTSQGSQASASVSTADIDAIAEAASTLLPSHGSTEGKEETVYVIADAAGQTQRTIVSAWLKNPEEADTITDRSDLQNIQNVKGDETYTVSGGDLVWDARGRDIYYQGDSEKELPLAVHVSYKLDGTEVRPEELAGASGHLEMTFRYENKTGRQEQIDGKDVTVYQPFVAVSCLVLDSSKASAVEVTNGTMINSGEQVIVAGMAMPGLKESLGLDELEDADGEKLDAEIPETVTINADVKDFSLLTTVTLVENALLNDLDLEDVDSFDELKSSVDKLTDASSQLVNGAGSLYDGTKTLSGGTDALVDGAVELDAGARTIADNMGELYNGILSVQKGAGELSGGLSTLQEKIKDLPAGVKQMKDGAETLKAALTEQVKPGAGTLQTGAEDISSGAKAISDGAQKILSELNTLDLASLQTSVEGMQGAVSTLEDSLGALSSLAGDLSAMESLPGVMESAKSSSDSAASTANGAKNIVSTLQALQAEYSESHPDIAAKIGSVASDLDTSLNAIIAASGASSGTIGTAKDGLKSAIGSMPSAEVLSGAISTLSGAGDVLADAKTKLTSAGGLMGPAAEGLNAIIEGAGEIAAGAKSGDPAKPGIYEGAAALAAGVDAMVSGNDGNNLDALIAGLSGLSDQSGELIGGVAALSAGVKSNDAKNPGVYEGLETLATGAKKLSAGTDDLAAGAKKLSGGTKELSDGVVQVMNGASSLLDGLNQFDGDGVKVLSRLFEEDAQGFMDRLRAVQAYGKEYDSFSGLAEGMPGMVRFIIRTDSIGD